MSTQKAQRQPLSDKHRMIIIITAIALAAVIAVSVTLGIMLKTPTKTPDTNDPSNSTSSSLPVKNGDFGIVSSEDTPYPKSATNWTKYSYKAPTSNGSTHDFTTIESTENVVMGIVDTSEEKWTVAKEDLKLENITLGDNPGQYSLSEGEKHTNSNVYMIATKTATNAAIMSDSVSVSATTSVKITVRINTAQLSEGNATIMIQNSSSTPNAKEENRYAYETEIKSANGWQTFEFHVFNRKTSTQYIRVCVGIGNVYTDDKAQGTIYIDDIAYETVTANDYRLAADEAEENDTSYKIIEKEEETTVPQEAAFLTLKDLDANEAKPVTYDNSNDYVTAAGGYSPFTEKDDFNKAEDSKVKGDFGIYMISNNGQTKTPVALELAKSIELQMDENDYTKQDYNHVSFWVRTVTEHNNALAYANIIIQSMGSDNEWEDLSSGNFTVKTEQDIKTDTNNGWNKYDVYLKPAKASTAIRIVFSLGSIKGYEDTDYAPEGKLYVTTPYFETISSSAYSSAASSTASKKFDLAGSTAETTVTNGSFSSITANSQEPSNWTPVFAGDNAIYRDGKGNDRSNALNYTKEAVAGSGVKNWKDEFTSDDDKYVDDDEGRILKLVSNQTSSFGYVSNEITASAHTVYVFSVLSKSDSTAGATRATPYFYLLKSGVERKDAVIASVENFYSTETVNSLVFSQPADSNYGKGWVRYYIVYVTGDTDTSVKLALFNGSLTDETKAAAPNTTIYYDKVTMQTLGTYSMVEDEENEDAEQYVVKFTASSGTDKKVSACEDVEQLVKVLAETLDNNTGAINEPTTEEWNEMRTIPEPKEDEGDDNTTNTPNEKADVNLGLLFSILSSVLLIAALAVVIVIKIYRNRKRNA